MGWRAPEVVNNMPRTAESDSFSVGLLAFFLLSKGHHPFGDGQGKGIDIARDQKIGAGEEDEIRTQGEKNFEFFLRSHSS